MTIPGINYVTAVTILAEAVDICRYSSAEKFAAAGGIIPSHRSSASTYHGGCITKQGSTRMRNAIVEAATTTARHDPRMKGIYDRMRKRSGAKKAKVAVARHMLETIWHMLTNGEEYRTQDASMTQRGYKRMERAAMAS
ncbi:MAG: transposase [Thaumarchaeota archaeon]|nr:transposase [Nitrososphaerota archaeon]